MDERPEEMGAQELLDAFEVAKADLRARDDVFNALAEDDPTRYDRYVEAQRAAAVLRPLGLEMRARLAIARQVLASRKSFDDDLRALFAAED